MKVSHSPTTHQLQSVARTVRQLVLDMVTQSKSAHLGSSFSVVDILVALYFNAMRVFLKNPKHPNRDRLLLSKGHAGAALYAVLGVREFFNVKLLKKYLRNGTALAGHASQAAVPGVELFTGSLGHGLPIGTGMAFAGKLDKKSYRVFVVMSDGECDEGSNWEAILFAGHHQLDNLVAVVDYNKWQSFGRTKDILDLEPFAKKWRDFGWNVKECNGHDFKALTKAFAKIPFAKGKPSVLIAHTVKGRGLPYENELRSHYNSPTEEEYRLAKERIKHL
ncbi:MAG: transketolase [Candidatus Brennerbacteria bacterium]|nr:transketolase [Candidatus Brennerbacteria bacterium]